VHVVDRKLPKGLAASVRSVDRKELRAELDQLVTRISQTVDERRRNGEYPIGLEEELDRHYREQVHHRRATDVDTGGLLDAMRHVSDTRPFDYAQIATTSGFPGGSAVHKGVGKLVGRQTLGALQQVQAWRSSIEAALQQVVTTVDALADHEHTQLAESVSAVLDRIAVLDQFEILLLELERRVDGLEQRLGVGHTPPA